MRTEDTYHDWCRRFILFHNKRHPQEMGEAEINAFLTRTAPAQLGIDSVVGPHRLSPK